MRRPLNVILINRSYRVLGGMNVDPTAPVRYGEPGSPLQKRATITDLVDPSEGPRVRGMIAEAFFRRERTVIENIRLPSGQFIDLRVTPVTPKVAFACCFRQLVLNVTAIERSTVELLMAGATLKEIATEHGVAESTVKVRLHDMRAKFGVRSNVELVVQFLRHFDPYASRGRGSETSS